MDTWVTLAHPADGIQATKTRSRKTGPWWLGDFVRGKRGGSVLRMGSNFGLLDDGTFQAQVLRDIPLQWVASGGC